jgi:hypothetical protein
VLERKEHQGGEERAECRAAKNQGNRFALHFAIPLNV